MEQWAKIPDVNYEVSTLGRVRNIRTLHIIKPFLRQHRNGQYYAVQMRRWGKQRNYSVHRLVAKAFIPNPCKLPEVNHLDCNTLNNNIDNLEWCTRAENEAHKFFMEFKA